MPVIFFFFFNDTATTEIYTLSLHDALPILANGCASTPPTGANGVSRLRPTPPAPRPGCAPRWRGSPRLGCETPSRSEEHTSELQSQSNLVCRLLLEKKKRSLQHPSNDFMTL